MKSTIEYIVLSLEQSIIKGSENEAKVYLKMLVKELGASNKLYRQIIAIIARDHKEFPHLDL